MKAYAMIEGLGDLAGLKNSTKVKRGLDESDTSSAKPLTEGSDVLPPPPLNEWAEAACASSDYYSYSHGRTFEEKVRHGIELIKMAISEEAHKNLGDDGKVVRKIRHESEDSPWTAIDRMLSKELYVDKMRPLVQGARAIIDEYLE